MMASELSQIEKYILIRAPRYKVWRALTNLEEFARWFRVNASGVFAVGARVDMISTHPLGHGASSSVMVEKMEPERVFSWKWQPGDESEATTLVEFRLEDVAGGTRVTVTESGFERISLAKRAKAFENNEKGWEIQMAALAEYAGSAA